MFSIVFLLVSDLWPVRALQLMELRVLVLFLFCLTLNHLSALFDRSCALSMDRPGMLPALQTEPFSTYKPCRYVRWRAYDEN